MYVTRVEEIVEMLILIEVFIFKILLIVARSHGLVG